MEMETLKCLSMIDDEPNNWIINEEGFLFKIESRLRRFLRKLYRNKIMLLIHRWMPKKSDELRPRTCDYSVWWTSKETTNNFLEFYCLFLSSLFPSVFDISKTTLGFTRTFSILFNDSLRRCYFDVSFGFKLLDLHLYVASELVTLTREWFDR